MSDAAIACPACGGSGGGPFGRSGSAWDVESYVCPRCQGAGISAASHPAALARPLAKGTTKRPATDIEKRGPVSTRPASESAKALGGGRENR